MRMIVSPAVNATFATHSGMYITPEMWREDYEEALLQIVERRKHTFPGMLLVEDTSENTHAIDIGDIAYIYCDEIRAGEYSTYMMMEEDIYDDYDDDQWHY